MELSREIEHLEAELDSPRVRDELATVRRGLSDGTLREPAIELPNLRLGFACKQRWEDMAGDDRVRACTGCDRPVFNLSEMTRAEAERVLATRGLTPCVRFYRRPDGTVMTSDCPTGVPRRHRLVLAGSLAAGTVLAASPSARAEPPSPETEVSTQDAITDDAPIVPTDPPIATFPEHLMGIPVMDPDPHRPAVEWSLWGRLGVGVATQRANVLARASTPPNGFESSSPTLEEAIAAELTVGVARDGRIRLGAWGELRTSSQPVAGGELVIEGLPRHPWSSAIEGVGSVVLRAGGNGHVVTAALGFGYVGSFPVSDPSTWMRHVVGARIVASINRSRDDARDWSATLGLEIEPIGALHAALDFVVDH